MIINSFFSKNNTLVFNSNVNTGKNPVAELFYGGEAINYSRFIFKIDLDNLVDLRSQGYFPYLDNIRHTLKLTNTGFFDWDLAGNDFQGKTRTSSFDLILFPITQDWDEGVGYDFMKTGLVHGVNVFSENPSNWYYASGVTPWSEPGVFSGTTTILATQHLEQGNENIELDITDYINSILSGGTQNYGLGIAYSSDFETLTPDEAQYVGFFTRHSQTAYEPYLQSEYLDVISDDRLNFQLNKDNRLYLYVTAGGQLVDLDEFPTVQILDDTEEQLAFFTSDEVLKQGKGVYYIELNIPSNGQNDCTIYNDIWDNVILNGVNMGPIDLDFTIKTNGYFNIGLPSKAVSNQVSYFVMGITDSEKLNRGVLRDVNILPKIKYTYGQLEQNLDIEYRLYMKEGTSEITVFDYSRTNSLYNGEKNFKLDTNSLLPSRYHMDLKVVKDGQVEIIKNVITFDVISETEFRISQ